MKRAIFLGSIALAFIAGAAVSHLHLQAQAATELTPMVIHVPDLSGEKLGMASGTGLRSKSIVAQDGMTLNVQAGPVPKHMHMDANEIQYYLEGTGTIWLGDKEVKVGPGDLVVIPEGHCAWRHEDRRRAVQGDRDQDAAAGQERHEAGGLTLTNAIRDLA